MNHPSRLLVLGFFAFWFAQDIYGVLSKSHTSTTRWPSRLPTFGRFFSPKNGARKSSISRSIDLRGGAGADEEADDERYSRQVYTLGARAHGLVRTATVYVDGPSDSGLVYECIKNLALSGVGNIVLWSSNDSTDASYHDPSLDDLGRAYQQGARGELEAKAGDGISPEMLMVEYTRRLNPAVRVSQRARPQSLDTNLSKGVILCVDRPYETQIALNKLARQQNLAFVTVETAGVYGRVFCDFGPEFEVYDADGEAPILTPLDRLVPLEEDTSAFLVHSVDAEKHDVSAGDTIQFHLSSGSVMDTRCVVTKVLTPYRIQVKLESDCSMNPKEFVETVNQQAASFSRVKIPTKITFVSLEDAMKIPGDELGGMCAPCDLDKSFDEVRRFAVLSSFQTLSKYVKQNGCLPKTGNPESFEKFVETCPSETNSAAHEKHVRNFVSCCAGKLTPLQTLFGAVAAQEALKAATGLYNPVKQILLYDCDELLSQEPGKVQSTFKSKPDTVSGGLAYILGKDLEDKLKCARLFVVGAGAIGCELLKNLAAMGAATGLKGCISLTDMDTIEKSNLSRQLLFRDSNIGDFKSVAAKTAILRMNPAINVRAYTNKVGEQSGGPFDDKFWSSEVDVVLNALDNMEARLFMDGQCVANQKALVDAGTLGSKGNVQVVIPHQSESYGSSVDPPEPAIPVCTLKNFPYAISHTIQWGRDLFDGLHQRRPRQANEIGKSLKSSSPQDIAQALLRDQGDSAAVDAAVEIAEDLDFASGEKDLPEARADAVKWATKLATRLFYHAILDLLKEHPADSLDEDGELFWSGTRKVPTPVFFASGATENEPAKVVANRNLLDFVKTAARLRLELLFGESANCIVNDEEAKAALLAAPLTDGQVQCAQENSTMAEELILSQLRSISDGKQAELKSVEFEKDDERNGHVAFVTAASNLRAICYGIPPTDAMETRRVAGKIVPAMITTTAVVSALSCLEFLKLMQCAPLTKHRNAFINLALPFFAFTVPVPAEKIRGPGGKLFTMWDTIVIKETKKKSGETKTLSLKRFMKRLKKMLGVDLENIEVTTVSAGQFMIYANFLNEDDKSMMRRSIFELAEEAAEEEEEFAGRSEPGSSERVFIDGEKLQLTVTVEDTSTGEEFELPPVHVRKAI